MTLDDDIQRLQDQWLDEQFEHDRLRELAQSPDLPNARAVLGAVKARPEHHARMDQLAAAAGLDHSCARRHRHRAGRDEGTAA